MDSITPSNFDTFDLDVVGKAVEDLGGAASDFFSYPFTEEGMPKAAAVAGGIGVVGAAAAGLFARALFGETTRETEGVTAGTADLPVLAGGIAFVAGATISAVAGTGFVAGETIRLTGQGIQAIDDQIENVLVPE